jgi:hypothetical protein
MNGGQEFIPARFVLRGGSRTGCFAGRGIPHRLARDGGLKIFGNQKVSYICNEMVA